MKLMQLTAFLMLLFAIPTLRVSQEVGYSGCTPDRQNRDRSDEIVWSEGVRLSWDDFTPRTGPPKLYQAYTTAGIRYEIDAPEGKIRIRTQAYFLKSESWVHTEHLKPGLLNHEQGHFDLAGLYSRRLADALKWYETDANTFLERNYNDSADAVFQRVYDELKTEQLTYDQLTVHGSDTEAQTRWNAWLSLQLD
ncbi:MAG: hypothetical protein ACFCUH_12105 [Flavobacteriales bacterium]